jgi:hypothetical protein
VEHACYRCGATVEEGVAFCPHCNAPLIRVSVPEVLPPPLIGDNRPLDPASYRPYPSLGKIQWSRALPVVLPAGLLAAILMMLPAGILGPIVAGAIAVAMYRRRTPEFPVTAGMGWRLGAATGVVGSVIVVVLLALQMALFPGGQFRETMVNAVRQAAERNTDPQAQQVVEYLKSPAGIMTTLIFGLIVVAVFCVILSSIGGAIGAAWFGKKKTG